MALARAVFAAVGAMDAARAALTHRALVPLWRPLVNDLAVVLTLHRFADPARGVPGTPIDLLRANLAFLRRHQFPIAALGDMLSGDPPGHPRGGPYVVFTVDDGYAEFASVAAPVFAEFDCPVTVFTATGPVDKGTWYWWDRVDFAIGQTAKATLSLDLGGRTLSWRWHSPADRDAALESVNESLKLVSDEEKERALVTLAEQLGVEIPSAPPPKFAAMSWDDVRRCAKMGVTFGPHSVTHPILPQVDAARADWEMRESWRRLQAECTATVPVFCYPNGAYSDREIGLLAATDMKAAVTMFSRYAAARAFQSALPTTRFAVPRFGYSGDPAQFVQIVTGLERLKLALRRGREGWRAVGA
jgi:peptidoglycan/xylan/chitin deacetylase (PgdA/CDA1 family)